jgi:tetratricopeptide (TPR) repeat protein
MNWNPDQARRDFQAALAIKPEDAETHRRLANLYLREGRIRNALCEERLALDWSLKPDTQLRLNYSGLLHQTGDLRGAIDQLRDILKTDPNSVEALNNLAWTLATARDERLRDGVEAVQLAERASRLPPVNDVCVPGTLAAAYAEAGRFSDAVATAENAIQAENASGQMQFAAINRQLLQLYRAGKPFHENPH